MSGDKVSENQDERHDSWRHPWFQPKVAEYKRWATEARDKVLAAEPTLNVGGFDYVFRDAEEKKVVHPAHYKWVIADHVDESRRELASDDHLVGIAASAVYILNQKLVKNFNRQCDSYGYKHQVERAFRSVESAPYVYVPAGGFIVAVIALGIPYRRTKTGTQILCPFSKKTINNVVSQ